MVDLTIRPFSHPRSHTTCNKQRQPSRTSNFYLVFGQRNGQNSFAKIDILIRGLDKEKTGLNRSEISIVSVFDKTIIYRPGRAKLYANPAFFKL